MFGTRVRSGKFVVAASLAAVALWVAPAIAVAANQVTSSPAGHPASVHKGLVTGPAGPTISGRYIVVLNNKASSGAAVDPVQKAAAASRDFGVKVKDVYTQAVHGYAFQGSADAAAAVSRDADVAFVTPDRPVHATGDQVVPTGVQRIGDLQNQIAKIGTGSNSVKVNVAVLDSGVGPHPDVNIAGGTLCIPNYGNMQTPNYSDDYGHGTHVAGIIGAIDNATGVVGVAPGTPIWSVKVLDSGGSGSWSDVICGINWVTATRTSSTSGNPIAVANMSLAGSGANDNNCGYTNNDPLHQAICASVAAGVVYVVAAGNSGTDASTTVPAAYPEVITVAALNDSDGQPGGKGAATQYGQDDTIASFSNYGSTVDIAAPGVNIYSTGVYLNGFSVCRSTMVQVDGAYYCTLSGTSMAAPEVTGAVALYVAANGMATNAAGVATIRGNLLNPNDGWSVPPSSPNGYVGNAAYGETWPELYVANGGAVPANTPPPTTPPTTAPPPPPSAPTNLTGAAVSSSQVNLSWTAVTGVAGYDVFRNGSQVATTSSTSYSNTGLTASTSETYYVKAYNSSGAVSSASNTVTVTTPAAVTTASHKRK